MTRETWLRQKSLMLTLCRQIVTSWSFFQFMANLEQSGSRIPDAWSVKFKFSIIETFNLTKSENRTKKSLTQLSYWKRFIFWNNKCVYIRTKFQVSSIILKSVRQRGRGGAGGGNLPPPQSQPLKSPLRLKLFYFNINIKL